MLNRIDSGIYMEMQRRLEKENDPYTLFDAVLNQSNPRDIRQVAANRINELDKRGIYAFLRTESIGSLTRIGRSRYFPTTITEFCKAQAQYLGKQNIITETHARLIELLEEQNRLLRLLAA